MAARADLGRAVKRGPMKRMTIIMTRAEKTPQSVVRAFMLLATMDRGGATLDGKQRKKEDTALHMP